MLDLSLMVVEDDPTLLGTLEKLLTREVREVRAFPDATKALEALGTYKPDVVLTDIKMPDIDGLEMVDRIRHLDVEIPVIVASAFSDPVYFQRAIRLKVENFVIKPIDVEELLDELRSIETKLQVAQGYRIRGKLLEEYKSIVDNSNNVTKTDLEGVITYANEKFAQLSGYSREELIGKSHNIVRHPDMPAAFFERLWTTIQNKEVWHGTIKNLSKNGETYYVETTVAPILDENDEIIEYISIKNNVTELVKHKKILQHQIMTDRLTDIPNRIKLKNDLKELENPTVILLDIDNFKEVNNLFGLYFGDQMLIYMAEVLRRICDPLEYTYYRISADEFIIGIPDSEDANLPIRIIEAIESYLQRHPFEYNSVSFDIELSFGIASVRSGDEKRILLAMADSALKNARESHHNYAVYAADSDPQQEYERNFTWTQNLKQALKDGRIDIFYHPIVSTKDGTTKKYECLVRYIDEGGNVIAPGAFLDIAKRSRLYGEITRTVIAKACETFSNRPEKFSVNLAIEDLLNRDTIDFLVGQVTRYGLEHRMIIEILESEGIDNFAVVISVIERLKTYGIEIAIDDFGTGYSNFAYLISLDIDTLKIDGSLIRDLDSNGATRSIVRSIVGFAHELGIKTVAEFVSSESLYAIVGELGVDFAQGYYLSEPLPFETLPKV